MPPWEAAVSDLAGYPHSLRPNSQQRSPDEPTGRANARPMTGSATFGSPGSRMSQMLMRATGYPLLAGAHLPVIPRRTFPRLLDSNPLRAGCVQQAIHTGGCHVRSVVTHTDRSTPERDHDE